MVLETLLALVEKLRERIDRHGDALRKSEALTRYALIDPLLRELGWDTEDPTLVGPEYGSGGGFADYALFSNNDPIMMSEAKKLDVSLTGARKQAVEYVMDDTKITTRYLSVTNGACWEIYDTNKRVSDMLVASFDLKSSSAADACLKALALWRPSVISGQIAVVETPVIGLSDNRTNATEPQSIEETTVQPTEPDQDDAEWTPLSVFGPQSGDPKPTEILFPDNTSVPIKTWKEIMVEVAKWLINENILTKDHCPISGSGTRSVKRYLISTDPAHSTGTPFKAPYPIDSFHLETNYSGPNCVENARTIIRCVGQDPARFKVRFPGP